jgi:predicted small secreted protein
MVILSMSGNSPDHPNWKHGMSHWRLVLLSPLVLSLSACNTVMGLGQDLQKAGEKIEDAAKKK